MTNNTVYTNAHTLNKKGIPDFIQQLGSVFLILVFSPLMIMTWLLIHLESKGPAVFTQIRVGRQGERFKLYKFRSMYLPTDSRYRMPDDDSSDRKGVCRKYFNDPRVTLVGKVIRKLSIDELPQLFNVLKGEMVLIGPRPALPMEVDAYRLSNYRRLDSKPGLTGLWQVSGRANTSFEQQLALDVEYVNRRSIGLDVKILWLTVPAVLGGEGAY